MRMERFRKSLFLVLFFFFISSIGSRSGAAESDSMATMKEAVDKILAVLKDANLQGPENRFERRKGVEQIVDQYFDFREMSEYTLSGYWETQSAEQKDIFIQMYSELVKNRYIGKVDNFSDQEVKFIKEIVRGNRAEIRSVLINKGTEIPIAYRLYDNGSAWRVYDMKIENVSLAVNYRSDFSAIIKKEGYAGLIEKLQAKLEEIRKADDKDN